MLLNMCCFLLEDGDSNVRNAHSNNIYGLEDTESTLEKGD